MPFVFKNASFLADNLLKRLKASKLLAICFIPNLKIGQIFEFLAQVFLNSTLAGGIRPKCFFSVWEKKSKWFFFLPQL